jgi:uncharacterized protein YgbK (DUF1537 family)
MLLGCIADDFTGASDLANTLAKSGLRTIQFIGVPAAAALADCEAGVVALKTRSIAADQAVAVSLSALEWLRQQGCRQYFFKYCSTFDSTPRGKIGPVGEALAEALGARGVVVCPAFPTVGRTVYQGHLFVGAKLLSESGMEKHPLNPMTDPDLARWLKLQCRHPVGQVAWPTVAAGPVAIRAALAASATRGEWLTVVDAIEDRDLLAIGAAVEGAPLLTGGSGVAVGLAGNFRKAGLAPGLAPAFRPVAGPAAVIAGSCSGATLNQVDRYRASHPALALDIDALMAGQTPTAALEFMLANLPAGPMCYSSASAAEVQKAHLRHGREQVAEAVESFFGRLATSLADAGVARLVVAGGETAGAVVTALGLASLAIGPEIDPGVPALSAMRKGNLALALKSGNFGGPDFFERALAVLEQGA